MKRFEDKKYSKTKQTVVILLLVTAMSFAGCGQTESSGTAATPAPTAQAERIDTGFVVTNPDSYDSADTAVLVDINNVDNTVTLLNLDLGKRYTLSMDGTTRFADKYGKAISLSQLQEGDIVDVTFLKSQKHLTSMQLAQTAWQYDDVEHYEMNTVRNEVAIGEEVFQLSRDTQYFSQGHSIEKMDLNPADILTFHGIDSTVLSVTVEKGHGYLRLVNDENFVGGWLEIGQTQIVRITEDMLVTVPEGSYQVDISYNGGGGTKNVVINRNEETTLDIGDLEVAEAQYGMVLFSLNPSDAELYIDGSQVDASQPVTLEYGIHQIIAKADAISRLHSISGWGRNPREWMSSWIRRTPTVKTVRKAAVLPALPQRNLPPPQIRLRPITACILMLRKMWRYIWTATMWEFPPAVLRRPQEVM